MTEPEVGQHWVSRDHRDHGLTVKILEVTPTHVIIKRFNTTRVRRDRFHKDYRYDEQFTHDYRMGTTPDE